MKIKIPLVVAFFAAIPALSSAFTLDFAGYDGTTVAAVPLVIFVPGYGNVTFEALNGASLPIDNAYLNDNGFGGPSLNFDPREAVRVSFNAAAPLNVDFDFVGVSTNEGFDIQNDLFTPQSFLITFTGPSTGAGLYAVSWNQVPEPASAMLGLVGTAVFALRRRR